VETQCLEKGINGTPAQQWRHPMTLTQRTHERHMNGKIKTGREAFGFRHQLTTERQCRFLFIAASRHYELWERIFTCR
jgi:hypothetical protein